MQTRILAAVLCGCALISAAVAETVVVNDQVQVRDSQLERPRRGATMDQVEKQFGAPATRHAAVGGSSQQQPPITRWDYHGFSVFFEHDRVIESVITGESMVNATSVATGT
ncbi:MAG: hypothetical protein JO158_07815 [Gammaproteobacteria bacterium]|nr:hypothetical protein [Gammaproteobacteria bacterium]MBV9317291.1 hypothetical protein [Gammaproteobacteria bacterium]MBV9727084.1 hypothetical protein [Gammaproteobacteria bacterium]